MFLIALQLAYVDQNKFQSCFPRVPQNICGTSNFMLLTLYLKVVYTEVML